MSSYPLPALQVGVPKQESYLDKLAKVQQLRNMAAQRQNLEAQGQLIPGQVQLQQQDIQHGQLVNDAAAAELQNLPAKQAFEQKKRELEWEKLTSDEKKSRLELGIAEAGRIGSLASNVKDEASKQQAIQQAVEEKLLDPERAQKMLQTPYDPATYQGLVEQAKTVQQKAAEAHTKIVEEETARHNKAMEGAKSEGSTDAERFVSRYLESNALPRTPANELKAQRAYIKESRTDPGVARAQIYVNNRAIQVADPNNPGETMYVPAGKAMGQGMAGASSSSVVTPKAVDRYFTSGAGGKTLTAFNTAIDHLGTLGKVADALGNGDTQLLNKFAQEWAQQTGSPAPVSFEAAKAAVSGEIAAAFKSSGATDQEIKQITDTFARYQSPAQLKAGIATYISLLNSKRKNLQQQFDEGKKGKPAFGGSTVKMQAPTGEVTEVPADLVEHYKSKGARVVN